MRALSHVLMGHLRTLLFFLTCGLSGFWGWVDAAMILNGSPRMADGQELA